MAENQQPVDWSSLTDEDFEAILNGLSGDVGISSGLSNTCDYNGSTQVATDDAFNNASVEYPFVFGETQWGSSFATMGDLTYSGPAQQAMLDQPAGDWALHSFRDSALPVMYSSMPDDFLTYAASLPPTAAVQSSLQQPPPPPPESFACPVFPDADMAALYFSDSNNQGFTSSPESYDFGLSNGLQQPWQGPAVPHGPYAMNVGDFNTLFGPTQSDAIPVAPPQSQPAVAHQGHAQQTVTQGPMGESAQQQEQQQHRQQQPQRIPIPRLPQHRSNGNSESSGSTSPVKRGRGRPKGAKCKQEYGSKNPNGPRGKDTRSQQRVEKLQERRNRRQQQQQQQCPRP